MAGYCKKHSPCARRLFSNSSDSFPTDSPPPQLPIDSTNVQQTSQPPSPPTISEPPGILGLRRSEALIYHALRSELPPEVPINPRAYLAARRNQHPNYRDLFTFFHNVFGYVEGTKGLMVILSNPNADMQIFGGGGLRDSIEDNLEAPGVRRLISLLQDDSIPTKVVFRAYRCLPSPRVSYLSFWNRKKLLHRFANARRRHPNDSLRYLSVIEDMCSAGLPLKMSLWTAAVTLAAKSSDKVSRKSFQSALGLWRRMEYEGKAESNSVAFNILFDLAIKAGQFNVAEKIVLEMHNRGVDFSRFGKVARIFYWGLRGDANGVRQAYHDFVNAGQIVDTTVLNCVMSALIRTGHIGLAEKMYDNMKNAHLKLIESPDDSHAALPPLPSDNYLAYRQANKYRSRIYSMASYLHDKLPKHHRAIQAAVPLIPDSKTFHIFLSYHAFVSGDLEKFLTFLQDLENTFKLPPQGMVYLFLFEGFARHGATKDSHWNYRRLTCAWEAFLRDLKVSEEEDFPRVRERISKLEWKAPLSPDQLESLNTLDESDQEDSTHLDYDLDEDDPLGVKEVLTLRAEDFDIIGDEDPEEGEDHFNARGVFLGRKLVIAILQAHFACGGPKAIVPPSAQYYGDGMKHQRVDVDFTLRRVFGKKAFRPLQREVIQAVIEGHDVFLQAATSFGKSICYQLPAVISHGITIVVSPLLSLMVDQVSTLEANGIPVATINSTTPQSKRKAITADILSGHPIIRLLYVTPEYCQTEAFRKHVKQVHSQGELNRIAIDEAHCVSEWGHDFRPAYKALSWFRRELQNPTVPITALTATATKRVRDDIISLLGLDPTTLRKFCTSSARPNIHYEVRYIPEHSYDSEEPVIDRTHDLLSWLKAIHDRRIARFAAQTQGPNDQVKPQPPPMSGIIYVPVRAMSSDLAERLSASISPKIKAVAYHAGLPASERASIQTVWTAPFKTRSKDAGKSEHPAFYIVVATNAFGMGIDNPQVRFVVHWTPPRSFEGFVQESGRAGRDGHAAVSLVYYSPEERERVIERILRDCNAGMLDATMISAGLPMVDDTAADHKRAYDNLSEEMKNKFRNRHTVLESFEKVVRYCEDTARCKHEIIREFSGDLELETSEPSGQRFPGEVSGTTGPGCDYACDFCKEGPKALDRKKQSIAYGLHRYPAQIGNESGIHARTYEDGNRLSWLRVLANMYGI
ncbi:hypothetical protein UREG_06789 [Uncinocarpus reesii 1704]|uniref:DNA 3'-5' helicase n=1 Tax=Uncinocarpus reesii (strain UAMH 1704) TaxID=336963 RepID=C4JW47_UNCRE|nr:uncharacterized protein UREG_06789 [Uncinocarpus reesii 1704]EEP81924.1 hypothetical protein UREG_06789 [Uncinocarpus reesii 1704]